MTDCEMQRLAKLAENSWYCQGANYNMIQYSLEIFSRYITDGSILELGPAEGVATELLVKKYHDITVVEGSRLFCEQLGRKFPNITIVNSLFEDFQPERKFDNIILGHVLEHVENPSELLKRFNNWLSDKGRIMSVVPNRRSLHRQAAVMMGLLKHEGELNETDLHHGHRRVYDPESFRADFINAGFKIEIFGGYWLKPISNKQIEDSWSEEMLNTFMALGERYPDISAEIYIIARK